MLLTRACPRDERGEQPVALKLLAVALAGRAVGAIGPEPVLRPLEPAVELRAAALVGERRVDRRVPVLPRAHPCGWEADDPGARMEGVLRNLCGGRDDDLLEGAAAREGAVLDQREAGGEDDGREGAVVGEGRSSDADEAVGKADVVQVVAPGVECVGIEEERQTCNMEQQRTDFLAHARTLLNEILCIFRLAQI